MTLRRIVPIALALTLSGCMGDNLGLESVHQPIVTAHGAEVPDCPDWRSQGKDSAASTDSNYGCATNSNLAAMIADPADLLHGRVAAPSIESGVRAVRALREAGKQGASAPATGGK